MKFGVRICLDKLIAYGVLVTMLFLSTLEKANAQVSVTSSDGYTVYVEISPQSIIAPNSCPYGYNYNVNLNYTVTFSGTNIPASLYTLQGSLTCSSQGNFSIFQTLVALVR